MANTLTRYGATTEQSAPPRLAAMYAVNLAWAPAPIPKPLLGESFYRNGAVVYGVRTTRPEGQRYGLRLGFFPDREAALRAALHLRGQYRYPQVVPVTPAERDRASALSPAPGTSPGMAAAEGPGASVENPNGEDRKANAKSRRHSRRERQRSRRR